MNRSYRPSPTPHFASQLQRHSDPSTFECLATPGSTPHSKAFIITSKGCKVMLADPHACAEGASPIRMLGASLARHAPSPPTPLARYFCVLTQSVLSRSSRAHSCTARIEKCSHTRCPRQRSRSTRPRYRGHGRSRTPEWPGWPRALARSHGHGGPAAAAAAALRGGRRWRLGVRERVLRGGSVASVARTSRVVQARRLAAMICVESGGLVVPDVPIYVRFRVGSGEDRRVRVS